MANEALCILKLNQTYCSLIGCQVIFPFGIICEQLFTHPFDLAKGTRYGC
jgi:hypothetical protein